MEDQAAVQRYLASALDLFGIEADETERAVMAGVWSVYELGMETLRDADLDEVELELRADLSQAPSR